MLGRWSGWDSATRASGGGKPSWTSAVPLRGGRLRETQSVQPRLNASGKEAFRLQLTPTQFCREAGESGCGSVNCAGQIFPSLSRDHGELSASILKGRANQSPLFEDS